LSKKILYTAISLAILLAAARLSPALSVNDTDKSTANPAVSVTVAPTPTPTPQKPKGTPALITDNHPVYMSADSQGNFHPEGGVTRAEACQILYGLMLNPVDGWCSYSDVNKTDQWYNAVACLTAWGILPDSGGSFRPDDAVTGLEFASMLKGFKLMPAGDVPLTDKPLTRAELCAVLNGVLGRSCDEGTLLVSGAKLFPDVSPNDPYFGDVMEASVSHDFSVTADGTEAWLGTALKPGLHPLYGRLYYVGKDGQLARNASYSFWKFGPDGRYTTGNTELDAYLHTALVSCVKPDMTSADALKAAYLYIKDNYSYLNFGQKPEAYGAVGWEYDRALSFFKNSGDTCYGFGASFGLLARSLGYGAYIVSGRVNEYHYPHSWVVIPEKGINYIYDVELEYARPQRHADLDLYRITNFSVYSYWYDPWW